MNEDESCVQRAEEPISAAKASESAGGNDEARTGGDPGASKTPNPKGKPVPAQLPRKAYTISIICTLEIEMAAVQATLDEKHGGVPVPTGDNNHYAFGRIGKHIVVIACPSPQSTASATTVFFDLLLSFPVKIGLMVGVGGGAWSEQMDVRLGDVVVSQPAGRHGGVVQWDYEMTNRNGMFWRTGILRRPPQVMSAAMQSLKAKYMLKSGGLDATLADSFAKKPSLFGRPPEHDELFDASYKHAGGETCAKCDRSHLVKDRPRRTDRVPRIHYGKIASSNKAMKHGWMRDCIAQEEGILCFDTEAAGFAHTPLRGDPRSVRLRRFTQTQVVAGSRSRSGRGVCERTASVNTVGGRGDICYEFGT